MSVKVSYVLSSFLIHSQIYMYVPSANFAQFVRLLSIEVVTFSKVFLDLEGTKWRISLRIYKTKYIFM